MPTTPAAEDKRPVPQIDIDYARNAKQAMRGDHVRGANFLLWSILAFFVSVIFWASKSEIDEVTKGQGKVIPSSSMKTIQNLEGGIVAELLVKEGDHVEVGQVLVRIDDTQTSSAYQENLTKSEALTARLARLGAESLGEEEIIFPESIIKNRRDLFIRETDLFDKRMKERGMQKATFTKSLKLASEELTMTIPLVQRGILSKVEQLRLERDVNEVEGKLKELLGGFQQEAMEFYNETKAEMEGLAAVMEGREDRVKRALVRSPVAGIVNKVYVSTIGGVLQGGEPIVDIVPHGDALVVEAKIRPSDIAFLRPGQDVILKFTAYDFSIFGGLEGKVIHISADTIQDEIDQEHYYMIKVKNTGGKLKERGGKELSIIPGMVAEVDVLTGRRTVLQYLTKPLHRMRMNSLTER